jgi:hypothetical protein
LLTSGGAGRPSKYMPPLAQLIVFRNISSLILRNDSIK